MRIKYHFLYTIFVALCIGNLSLRAALVEWDGGGADDNWTSNLNWSGDTLPTSGTDSVHINTGGAKITSEIDMGFTVGNGQTLSSNNVNSAVDWLIFRIGNLGASGELRFATGSTLDFDKGGFITERGSVNQRVTFEAGATLSAWRYFSNAGFTTRFEADASGISTFFTTDTSTTTGLRTRGALELDLTNYDKANGNTFILFDYATRNTSDSFSSVTVTDASGVLTLGTDYTLDYAYDQGGGDLAVALALIPEPATSALLLGCMVFGWLRLLRGRQSRSSGVEK